MKLLDSNFHDQTEESLNFWRDKKIVLQLTIPSAK